MKNLHFQLASPILFNCIRSAIKFSVSYIFKLLTPLFIILFLYGQTSTIASAAVTFRAATSASTNVIVGGGSITHIGAGTASSRTGCGNINPLIPAGNVGDLLIAVAMDKEDDGGNNITMASWNTYYSATYVGAPNNNEMQVRIFWRIATATNPNTITQSGSACSGFAGQISRFRGVNSSSPFQTVSPGVINQDSGNIDSGTITTTSATAMALVVTFVSDDRNVAEGAGWSQSFDYTYNDGGAKPDLGISLNYQLQTTAGNKSISNWDLSGGGNDENYGVMLALTPAGGGGGAGGLTINVPAGTISGDVMIASVSTTPSTITNTEPVGWTLIGQVTQSNPTTSMLKTYYKVAGGSEPADYTWTLSSAGFIGASGGIATFIGVDKSSPIDAQAGSATPRDRDHTAPTVITTMADGMLVTIHELASSGTWTSPTGMTEMVDTASETPTSANGISMGMYYEARPVAGNTGTRTARSSANGGNRDFGATQSVSLKPGSPLVCFNDDFNRANGPPGSNWVVSNNSGAFGNPVIFNNRLRMTNASGNVATMATLQQIFPGAGNRIEVEFDFYAYGGSGADGIAVILSNYAVTPLPGGYGGSLGYAQRTGINGFAGGWLGVGIDEYGNFSNPSEGRVGGPGPRIDSISVRGSGTGTSGYAYHAGTAASLAPQVDNNGAASPPHRYRIIIDHSNGTNAWVSVERNTGAGYVMLVAPYDAKAQAGQAAVPTTWILSYTGSTGGATNIHEIDSLRVCATAQTTVSGPDHFAINYASGASGTGVNCQAEALTIEAHDVSHNIDTTYTGTITLNTSTTNGDWSKTTIPADALGTLTPGAGDSGNATYAFDVGDGGSVILNFKDTHTETANINITAGSISELSNAAVAADDYEIAFAATGFIFLADTVKDTIGLQIGGKPSNVSPGNQTLELQAVKTSTTTGACEAALQSNQSIEIAFECINPIACTGDKLEISIDDGASYTTVTANSNGDSPLTYQTVNNFNFGNATDTTAPFVIRYNDVGNVQLHARKILSPSTEEMLGSSNAFVVRPFAFYTTVTGNPAAISPAGTAFTSAGTDFTVNTRAVLWQSTDDDASDDGSGVVGVANDGIADGHESTDANPANNVNLSDNPVANNYGQEVVTEQVLLGATLDQPTGINPGLDDSSTNGQRITSFTVGSGVGTSTTINYDEVGIVEINAIINDNDYLGIGLTESAKILGRSGYVGRFFPEHFETLVTHACNNTYTYSGQPYVVTVYARNKGNSTTQNYRGTFAYGVTLTDANPVVIPPGPPGIFANNSISSTSFSSNLADDGGFYGIGTTKVANNFTYTFTDKDTIPETLELRATDVNDTAISSNGFTEDTSLIRSGRLRLENVYGSELTPLNMTVNAEYYTDNSTVITDDDGFILNTDDSCTTFAASSGAYTNYTGNLSTGEVAVTSTDTITTGFGNISFHQPGDITLGPGAGNEGSVNLLLNTISSPSWLTFNWNIDCDNVPADNDITTGVDAGLCGPVGTASFGLYRGDDRIIYWREVFE